MTHRATTGGGVIHPLTASAGDNAGASRAGFTEALADLALSVQRKPPAPASALAIITEAARASARGADCAAVAIPAGSGKLSARAVHGDLPCAVLALQDETGQGRAWTLSAGRLRSRSPIPRLRAGGRS